MTMDDFKVNETFAKKYNEYRRGEELMKMKARYGDVPVNGTLDEEEESEDEAVSDFDVEDHEFLRLYSAVSGRYPRIYEPDTLWFHPCEMKSVGSELQENGETSMKKKKKREMVSLKDHNRKFILEKGGVDGEEEAPNMDSDYFHRQMQNTDYAGVKESRQKIMAALESDDEEDLVVPRAENSSDEEEDKSDVEGESKYRAYLKGETSDAEEDDKKYLEPLKQIWSKPGDDTEKYWTDFFINQKYKKSEKIHKPRYKDIVGSDSDEDDAFRETANAYEEDWSKIDADEELTKRFPRTAAAKYRFEEVDKEFIKTYPRQVENSLRQTKGESRSEKRRRRQERKDAEKATKFAGLEALKKMKMAELSERLEKIKRTAGMDYVKGIKEEDLEEDWDPEKHDKIMKQAFSQDYDAVEDYGKPVFSSDSDEVDEENDWDGWTGPKSAGKKKALTKSTAEVDHDLSDQKEDKEEDDDAPVRSRTRRHKKRGSVFRKAIETKKPVFNPDDHPDFAEYFEEVYQLDCEDIIAGDLHCRFKYRDVEANDFGLSTEEVLAAKVDELNRWVSVKRMSQYRSKQEEEKDKRIFQSMSKQKKKADVIPSLIEPVPEAKCGAKKQSSEKEQDQMDSEGAPGKEAVEDQVSTGETKKKRKKKKRKNKNKENTNSEETVNSISPADIPTDRPESGAQKKGITEDAMDVCEQVETPGDDKSAEDTKKKRRNKRKNKANLEEAGANSISPTDEPESGTQTKGLDVCEAVKSPSKDSSTENSSKKNRKRKIKNSGDGNSQPANEAAKRRKQGHSKMKDLKPVLSDARLAALQINPKSYKYLKVKHIVKPTDGDASD